MPEELQHIKWDYLSKIELPDLLLKPEVLEIGGEFQTYFGQKFQTFLSQIMFNFFRCGNTAKNGRKILNLVNLLFFLFFTPFNLFLSWSSA